MNDQESVTIPTDEEVGKALLVCKRGLLTPTSRVYTFKDSMDPEYGEQVVGIVIRSLQAIQVLKKQLAEAENRIMLAGGYHDRTEREVEIEAALEETPPSERDPADVAIAELLALVDAGRNRVHEEIEKREAAEREREDLLARVRRAEKNASEALSLCEELAAAGYRIMQLAGGAEIEGGVILFACKDGTFSEEITFQRVKALRRDAMAMAERIAAQSELLTKKASKAPSPTPPPPA